MLPEPHLLPDPIPLREALRGLRHMLRRGGETLADTLPVNALPKPAADIAGAVLREVEGIARGVDGMASGLAKTVLGDGGPDHPTLNDLSGPGADHRFAAATYAALRSVLDRLGAPGVFVSEAAALEVHATAQDADAARLTLALLDARVIRGATADEAARVPGSALAPVAVFAVMLWLQSDRTGEDDAALDAATDIAVTLAAKVASATVARDEAALSALYAKYAAHV